MTARAKIYEQERSLVEQTLAQIDEELDKLFVKQLDGRPSAVSEYGVQYVTLRLKLGLGMLGPVSYVQARRMIVAAMTEVAGPSRTHSVVWRTRPELELNRIDGLSLYCRYHTIGANEHPNEENV